ncbi:MAG TPA: alpha/beta hydrolase [Tepidisphaeraceae bacterium]|jgi:pimeloyl-ACP methyl ester carboxylesterase|nr:alpha/beta hydrolase [Tepidisphaeraceae bacterium]
MISKLLRIITLPLRWVTRLLAGPSHRPLWRRALRTILSLVLLWLLGTGIAATAFTRRLTSPKPQPAPVVSWGVLENLRLKTSDGQEIGAWLNPSGTHAPVVLFLHGIGDTRSFWLPQMQMLAQHGYASMAISFRAHGDSSGRIEDFGYSGRHDVQAAVEYLHARLPGRPIVLVGDSLGSAAAIYAAKSLDHHVAGYFLESPYHDLETAVRNRTNRAPPPFNWIAFQGLRLWAKVLIPEKTSVIRPIDDVGNIPTDVPVVFLATRRDRWCQLWEVEDLHKAIAAHAKLVVIDSDKHGACSRTDSRRYDAELLELLERAR